MFTGVKPGRFLREVDPFTPILFTTRPQLLVVNLELFVRIVTSAIPHKYHVPGISSS